jgi:hypothetical protein
MRNCASEVRFAPRNDGVSFGGARTRGLECALFRAAGRFAGRGRVSGEAAMSLGTILIIILIIILIGGYSGRFGGYGYGLGHSGMGPRRRDSDRAGHPGAVAQILGLVGL